MRERTFTRAGKRVSTRTPGAATQLLAQGWQEVDTTAEPQPESSAGKRARHRPDDTSTTTTTPTGGETAE